MSTEQDKKAGSTEQAAAIDAEQQATAESPAQTADEVALTPEQLQSELQAAQARAEENWDKWLRSQAELDNVRKRAARDVENARKYALEGIASELLPVRDSLELGLDAINKESADLQSARNGLQLIQQMLAKLMEQYGIRPVEPQGEAFDPELHQAMGMQETDEQTPNTVLTVMQKGYTLNERLLRPAMVVVARAPQPPAPDSDANPAD